MNAPANRLPARIGAVTAALALLSLLGSAVARAQTFTIDFDTDALGNPIAEGTTIAEQYAAWGVHFEPNVFGGLNLTGSPFATNTDMTATASDVGFIDDTQPLPTGNLLGGLSGYQASDGDPNFWIRLDKRVSRVSMDIFGDGTFFGNTTLYGFDQDLNPIDQVFLNEFDGQETLTMAGAPGGYSYIGVVGDSDFGSNDAWVGIDNIRLTAAPEPGTLGLLLGGMALAAGMVQRRRRRTHSQLSAD
jgi:hypothetical protein